MTLQQFLDASPVNFLAVNTLKEQLNAAGFQSLDAAEPLTNLTPGSKFYVTKNDSSLYAFQLGKQPLHQVGARIICAHCDSPTFRIKPHAEITCEGGLLKLNTEVYGGAILSTWFDRPLSLAGRVICRGTDALHPQTRLLHIQRPLLTIPNLAIHFNRQVNDGVKLSKQKDMLPIMGYFNNSNANSNSNVAVRASCGCSSQPANPLTTLIASELGIAPSEILDFDLYLYDTTPACTFGLNNEFISAGRLDDLSMVHAGLTALLQTINETPEATRVLAIFDNEETGSQTKQGAGSPFFASLLQRIVEQQGGNLDAFYRCVEKSFMISADNAHAWHPNYSDKYDPTNHPLMGHGPIIKYNAAQKYMSDAASAAVFASICEEAGVPCQRFVNHSDVAGGSTLGNILSATLPLRGVDMGNPIWAMHSCRETGNIRDHEYCTRAFAQFYS